MSKTKNTVKTGISIDSDLLARCDASISLTNAQSRSEFISDAIEYYIASLNAQGSSKVLTPALESVIGSVRSIRIGDCVIFSNHVHIYDNNNHPTDPEIRRKMCMAGFDGDAWKWKYADSAPIVIEDNVWIGEYAAVLKGVTIGEGAIVASHAVVTEDVPPYTIVAGNPARVVKEIGHET